MSAPHIYHSGLFLSPQTLAVRSLYEQYTRPLVRVVRGFPITWGLMVSTVFHHDPCLNAFWSPCNKFIAVTKSKTVELLDAVTLKRLVTFTSPGDSCNQWLSFSPDSRFLTQFHDGNLTAWDLQTGGTVCTIPPASGVSLAHFFSSAYSTDGKVVAVACRPSLANNTIATYDLLSNTYTRSYQVPDGHIIIQIWTHAELLRFATVKPGFITTWEAPFTLIHDPTEVESLPIPEDAADGGRFLFLPALFRLAFVVRATVFVWDANASRLLLESGPISRSIPDSDPPHFGSSFSSDGRFFAYMDTTQAYVWKESPTGYILHQKLEFDNATTFIGPLLSPDGGSVIVYSNPTLNLWLTKDQHIPSSDVPTRDDSGFDFVLEFSPDETLAAYVRLGESLVTIIDLKSGDPRLIIDTGMRVEGLGVAGSTVVVADGGKIVTWNLPSENCAPNTTANVNDSVRTTPFNHPLSSCQPRNPIHISISPDLSRFAISGNPRGSAFTDLEIRDVSTGRCLASTTTTRLMVPWFTPDGCEVWGVDQHCSVEGWEIIEDRKSGLTELKPLIPTARPPEAFSFLRKSPRGYELTDDGWLLSPTKKRLLCLPDRWKAHELYRTWGERFLGLRHGTLEEVVIMEFLD